MSNDKTAFQYVAERFADIQMLRYRLNGFAALTPRQKRLIYYLSQATLSGRDITFDQFGASNIKIRKTLEALYLHYTGARDSDDFRAMEEYLKCVWFASGIHHHYNQTKFTPHFSETFFQQALHAVPAALLPLAPGADAAALANELTPIIFDPDILKKRVCLDEGVDKVIASAGNFYHGVTQAEAEDYYAVQRHQASLSEPPSFGLNTTLVKDDGHLREVVWRVGGKYSKQIERIVYWLQRARTSCESKEQDAALTLLIDYYLTGNVRLFDKYSIAWLSTHSIVDFINGFIEVYQDPIGIKGSWEGIVHYADLAATRRTQLICSNAQWFEDHSPIDARFRKAVVRGVSATVVCAAMLGGDEYPASAIGINLPNADWIRARHGSKSITIGNLTEAYNYAARNSGLREEFIADAADRAHVEKYGDMCDDLHTDLHECLGHGSGRLLDGVAPTALREYGSTIEEARADLFALYYLADPRLVELHLLPNDEAYKAQYYSYMLNGLLTQLARIPLGGQIEEAHMRNRALIARWAMEHSGGTVALVTRGTTTLHITDYVLLRQLFATLLAEVQRIKSEGDYPAAHALVERYGVTIDKSLHREVLRRYAKLNIAPYKGFINPVLRPIIDAQNGIVDIAVDYSEGYAEQMLRYSREY